MRCDGCARWTIARQTHYQSGDVIDNFRAPDGKGECSVLSIVTDADFGCNKHEPSDWSHIVGVKKAGAPWQHSHAGPCPDCVGKGNAGDGGCKRCAGTGQVRHYDDGYIGEEQTRMHPKEREQAALPTCGACGAQMQRTWVACPACGHRKEMPAQTEVVPLDLQPL